MLKYNKKIKNIDDVVDYFTYLIKELDLNLHPDTDFSEYVSYETGENTFNQEEVCYLNSLMDDCFSICEEAGVDVYEVGLKIMKGKPIKSKQKQQLVYQAVQHGDKVEIQGSLYSKNNGKHVVLSDEAICEYDNKEALDATKSSTSILLH